MQAGLRELMHTTPNATLLKFGYPDTLLHEGRHWAVLVRPAQPTLGSLILCALGDYRSYGDLPVEAFAEQGRLVAQIERLLRSFCRYERINYLMLMMVDPNVHFHVVPRYDGNRVFEGVSFPDTGWPTQPNLAATQPANPALVTAMRTIWQSEISQEDDI